MRISSIVEKLKTERCRSSTRATYHKIWRLFGKFYERLDYKPKLWQDKIVLFAAYLIEECRLKSNTVKSYISAIKGVLAEDGIPIETNSFVMSALTRACKLKNDRVIVQFPIYRDLLKLILDEVKKFYDQQPYLSILYQVLFSAAYYSLLRIGEVTSSPHVITVRNTHIATNKNKILFMLLSSKTHNRGDKPQRIKITSIPATASIGWQGKLRVQKAIYCPFTIIKRYINARPVALSLDENFFVFSDRSPVNHVHARSMLKLMIQQIGLDSNLYNFHSIRIGRGNDLLKLGLSVEIIKKLGRWRSNAVFAYLRD